MLLEMLTIGTESSILKKVYCQFKMRRLGGRLIRCTLTNFNHVKNLIAAIKGKK